jgi:hypothetical protein
MLFNQRLFCSSIKYSLLIICFNAALSSSYLYADTNKVLTNVSTNKSFSNTSQKQNLVSFQLKKDFNKISSQISLNAPQEGSITHDGSFLNFQYKDTILGIGKIHRNWSFSTRTSLILSSNPRPTDSIYLIFNSTKKRKNTFLSSLTPKSFEIFNSLQTNTNDTKKSMLLGMRAVIKPLKNLNFEILKTSQWGGADQGSDLSALGAAAFGNTNEYKHRNINQMAGIGASYTYSIQRTPIKSYLQLIGEDEAGGLPSCYMSLLGTEMNFQNIKYLTNIGIEYVDTRIGTTDNGNCGPNTAYNNAFYKYTNYGTSMGAPIDTEGRAISLWGNTQLSSNIKLNYSIDNNLINNANLSSHRLSSIRKKGWSVTLGSSWVTNKLEIRNNIKYQNYDLEKINVSKGLSLNINTSMNF